MVSAQLMPQWKTTEESDMIETFPFSNNTSEALLSKVTEEVP